MLTSSAPFVCDVRRYLSLFDVAAKAADADALEARLANLFLLHDVAHQYRELVQAIDGGFRRQPFHLQARHPALAGTFPHYVGLPHRVGITLPLVWGWMHFSTVPGKPDWYRAYVFGFAVMDLPALPPRAVGAFAGRVMDGRTRRCCNSYRRRRAASAAFDGRAARNRRDAG